MATLQQLARICESNIALDIPTMILGAPGIGKSQLAAQLAERLNFRLIDFRALLRDPVDLRGLPVPDMVTNKTTWLQPDDLPFMPYDGEPCLLFMDEINTAAAAMQNACLGLVLERRIGQHVLAPSTRILAAGNRQSDRAAVSRMSSALESRFAMYTAEPDSESFVAHATRIGMHASVVAFIRFRPALLADYTPSTNGKFSDPRAWEKVSRIMHSNIAADIRHETIAGIVGDGCAAEFESFLRVWQSLPPIAEIIANPDSTRVPDDPATLYAIATALSRKATVANFDSVMRYGNRMPCEFGVVLMTDAIRRDDGLKNSAAYTQWAIANQHVTL